MREKPATVVMQPTGKTAGATASPTPTPAAVSSRWLETEPGIFRLDDEQRLPGGWTSLRVATC